MFAPEWALAWRQCCAAARRWRRNMTAPAAPTFIPHTLQEAFAAAYLTNPQLQAERAALRAVDENVPTALAGWRPTVIGTATLSYDSGVTSYGATNALQGGTVDNPGYTGGVTITQPLYAGGRTTSQTHQAVNRVMAERANLIATEQQVFLNVVSAYVGVIQNQQNLQIQTNNEHVLSEQLRATNDRFRVGEITRTDVAQAEAALANGACEPAAGRRHAADRRSDLCPAGRHAAGAYLIPPQPLALPVRNEQEVMSESVSNNPNVINALFTQSQQKDAVDVAMSALMPKVSAEAAYQHGLNQGIKGYTTDIKSAC